MSERLYESLAYDISQLHSSALEKVIEYLISVNVLNNDCLNNIININFDIKALSKPIFTQLRQLVTNLLHELFNKSSYNNLHRQKIFPCCRIDMYCYVKKIFL